MSAKPWYPWYVPDWRAKTVGLSAEQRGVYRELLDECYMRAGPLPADLPTLFRIAQAHTPSEKAAVEMICDAFFVRRGELLFQGRVEDEIDRSRELSEFGRIGGLAAKAKREAKGIAKQVADTVAKVVAEPIAEVVADLQAPQPQPHTTATSTKNLSGRAARAGLETAETWEAYSSAYLDRYGTEPVRNARGNTQLVAFVKAVGKSEAPHVAAFYVRHNRQVYVAAKHPVNLLLRDAEGIRTDWATNRQTSETEARQVDRTQATGSVFRRLIEEAEQEQGRGELE